MREILDLFRIDVADADLARAQFRSFARLVPLLYLIVVFNALAVALEFRQSHVSAMTFLIPATICTLAVVRAGWWLKQRNHTLSDEQISRHLTTTCHLAVVMTLAFMLWAGLLYPFGDAYARGHLTFFLALSQVSTVFCLMTMRAAAFRVAATSTLSFMAFFLWVDDGRMAVEALVLALVALGMMTVTHSYNQDFSKLIKSQRDLRWRQAETEKLSEENRQIALTDALSGLPNRRALLAHLDDLEARAERRPDQLAVIFIDLDGFKDINDTHGHQAGDMLIRSLAARFNALCQSGTTLARVGGDEFAVLIEADQAIDAAHALARSLNEEISLPVLVDRHVLQVGASIGVAGDDDGTIRAHELLRRADTAMYAVKLRGKGEIAIYDSTFDEGRMWRLTVEREIGEGLARGEFAVFYQPVVHAQTSAIVGAEALIRWPGRPAGPLGPERFIEIAEATGQIHPLGLFVLERACRDLIALDGIKLSVNVSPAQFRDPGFERQVAHVLEQTRFPPERLQFEITEGYLLHNPERAVRAIESFRSMGISVALDDFGTGFTSIHYLQSYGFSHIKIDKSLSAGLGPDSKAALLVTGTVYLANGLDMRVIAEGVETEEQAAMLRAAGCHKLQGYLFGRPAPLADFLAACARSLARHGPMKLARRAG